MRRSLGASASVCIALDDGLSRTVAFESSTASPFLGFVDACFTWAPRPCQRVFAVADGEVRSVNCGGPQKTNQSTVTQANFAVAGEL